MRSFALHSASLWIVVAAFAAAAGGAEPGVIPGHSVKEFRYPVLDGEGRKTSELRGATARVREDGGIEVTDLVIEVYEGGAVSLRITSAECVYKPARRIVTSDSAVRVERKNMVISGTGFLWRVDEGRVDVFQNVKVVVAEGTRIESADKMEL